MQVSIPVGIFIIACIWSLPVFEAWLITKFIKWQEWRNRDPKVTIEDTYDQGGNLVRRVIKEDETPRILIGFDEKGF